MGRGRDWLTAAIGIAMLGWYVSPRRNTADVLAAFGQSYGMVIRAAVGAVEARNPDAGAMLRAMPADARETVLDLLTDADRFWVESMQLFSDVSRETRPEEP